MLPGPDVPGCSLVSFHFLWAIQCPQAVLFVRKIGEFFKPPPPSEWTSYVYAPKGFERGHHRHLPGDGGRVLRSAVAAEGRLLPGSEARSLSGRRQGRPTKCEYTRGTFFSALEAIKIYPAGPLVKLCK